MELMMKKFYQKCIWLFPVVLLPFSAAAQGILPTQLQCESKSNPIGICETSPRLSWQDVATVAGTRGQSQTAYQIQVASSSQLLAGNHGDLWDTGQITTNQTAQIPYAGSTLTSDEVCYWHVRVWDGNGQPSAWSSPVFWSIGMLTTGEWTAQWIGRDDAPACSPGGSTFPQANWIWFPDGNPAVNAPVATRWFRKVFTVPVGVSVSQATATMTADNSFILYVNGQAVLSGTSWSQTYQTDISSLLVAGTNILAVAAVNSGNSPNAAGLIGAFDLKFSNGQTNSFQTDGSWISANQLFASWNQTNFASPGWANALVMGAYGMSPWGSFVPGAKTYYAATMLRKDFNLSQLPSRAILYVTGQGLVEPHLNGAKVGNDCWVPGWTDYNLRLYYRTYDVTSLLQQGSNTLGAILGDGWYRGNIRSSAGVLQNNYGTRLRLRAELHLFYASGTNQIIVSDGSWKAGFGPILADDRFDGETYDARLEQTGWDSPGFSNASWTSVTTGAEHSPVIQAYPEEPVQTNQALVPVSITQPRPGLYVFNFGQNIAGWAHLQVTNQPAGTRIVMRFGEWLNPDGTVYRDNLLSAQATDTYICKGGMETWEPHFTYHGFQYLEVQGLAQAPTSNTLTALVVHSGLSEAGSFKCSNPLINQIHSNMLWSLRGNYFDVPTDCPQRDERDGWCDGLEVMRSGMFNFQAESFYSKWDQDIVDSKARVTIPDCAQMAPVIVTGAGDSQFSSGWQDAVVFVPYWIYQTYGDLRPARRSYTDMVSHMDYYAAHSSNFIGPSGTYGDWLAVDGSTPRQLISTAFYARCAFMMAEMAQALGKTSDAANYAMLFTNICSAFQANFVTGDGTVGSGSEGCYALALDFNLLTPAQRILAANKLAVAISAQGGHPSTGMVTTHLLLPALTSIGRNDLAYQMLEKTDYPSWGYWINLGATTMWENWSAVNADGTINTSDYPSISLNHVNFGACAEWLYRGILGIDQLQPGFKKILISPQIGGGLTWAQGSYDSIQGKIVSAWQLTNNILILNATIPANTTAEIHMPTTHASAITESGVPAASAPDVIYIGVSNNAAIYAVGPGNYIFSSPFSIPGVPSVIETNAETSTSNWGVASPNLIAGQLPGSYDTNAGDSFTADGMGGNGNGGLLALTDGVIGASIGSGASCGGTGQGGGIFITYSPTHGSWTLTNIVVYTGWPDYGRAGQFYNISYALLSNTNTAIPLASISYNPSFDSGTPWETRVTISPPVGQTVLATNVAAVHFDFTPQGSEDYGYSSYTEIVLQGSNLLPAIMIPVLDTPMISGGNLILEGTGGTPNAGYSWLTTTNLSAPINWTTSSTDALDGAGSFSNSIPISTINRAMFFQFRLP
jgi:alpha-L-rhamnosidase